MSLQYDTAVISTVEAILLSYFPDLRAFLSLVEFGEILCCHFCRDFIRTRSSDHGLLFDDKSWVPLYNNLCQIGAPPTTSHISATFALPNYLQHQHCDQHPGLKSTSLPFASLCILLSVAMREPSQPFSTLMLLPFRHERDYMQWLYTRIDRPNDPSVPQGFGGDPAIDDGSFMRAWERLQEACSTIQRSITEDDDSDHEEEVSDANFTLEWGIRELQLQLRWEGSEFCKDLYISEVLNIHQRLNIWMNTKLEAETAISSRDKDSIRARWVFTIQDIRILKQGIRRLPQIPPNQHPQGFEETPSIVRLSSMLIAGTERFVACMINSSDRTIESISTHPQSDWPTTAPASSTFAASLTSHSSLLTPRIGFNLPGRHSWIY